MSKAKKIVDRLLNEEDMKAEVLKVIDALQQAGLFVNSESQAHHISLTPDPEGEAVSLTTGDRAKINVQGPDDDDLVTYDVFPQKDWETYVEKADETGEDWAEEAEVRGDEFEEIISGFGYELGSVGGHPPNFDYHKQYGATTVIFAWWGNPHHI